MSARIESFTRPIEPFVVSGEAAEAGGPGEASFDQSQHARRFAQREQAIPNLDTTLKEFLTQKP